MTFYIEDHDYKPVDFNGEKISVTCQLIKIYYSYLYTYNYMSIVTHTKILVVVHTLHVCDTHIFFLLI